MRRVSSRWVVRLALSLMVTGTVVVIAAAVFVPHIHRWHTLNQLESDDAAARERALKYVIRWSPDTPLVLRGAVARLRVSDRTKFLQLVNALDVAGHWSRPTIPDEPWLRWLEMAGRDENAEVRILASQRLADMGDLAEDPRLPALLRGALTDESEDVRYNALVAAAELSGAARSRDAYTGMLLLATGDPQPIIARKAWLYAGLLRLEHTGEARYFDAPPLVGQAMVWALARSGVEVPEPGEGALHPALSLALRDAREGPGREEQVDWPEDLMPLLRDEDAAVRDVACAVAASLKSDREIESLAGELLRGFDDLGRMSGAVLCGLTGVRPTARLRDESQDVDLLRYVREYPNPVLSQVARLALWMRGDLPDSEMILAARALLTHPDMPSSTVLLAILHKGRREALDHLLEPRGEADLSRLAEHLLQKRWLVVLRRSLPADAPDPWLDADPALQLFQLELLREWWVLNRQSSRSLSPTGESGP